MQMTLDLARVVGDLLMAALIHAADSEQLTRHLDAVDMKSDAQLEPVLLLPRMKNGSAC